MIQISLTHLLLLGMILGLATLAAIWIFSVWRERRTENRARQDLVSCRICGNIYENAAKRHITSCPRCGSLNESLKPKPI